METRRFLLHTEYPAGIFIQTVPDWQDTMPNGTYRRSVLQERITLYSPSQPLLPGMYALDYYVPSVPLSLLCSIRTVTGLNTKPGPNQQAYAFQSNKPFECWTKGILFLSRSRISSFPVEKKITSTSLRELSSEPQMVFKGPDFSIHHAVNTATLISAPILQSRLERILTSL